MEQLKEYYLSLGIDEKVYEYVEQIENRLTDRFRRIDRIAQVPDAS